VIDVGSGRETGIEDDFDPRSASGTTRPGRADEGTEVAGVAVEEDRK
jgi:hypothetical protein